MREIPEAEAVANFQQVLAFAEAEGMVVITRDGEPLVEVRNLQRTYSRTQAEAVAAIRELRKQIKPDTMTIREMIDEGRRF